MTCQHRKKKLSYLIFVAVVFCCLCYVILCSLLCLQHSVKVNKLKCIEAKKLLASNVTTPESILQGLEHYSSHLYNNSRAKMNSSRHPDLTTGHLAGTVFQFLERHGFIICLKAKIPVCLCWTLLGDRTKSKTCQKLNSYIV